RSARRDLRISVPPAPDLGGREGVPRRPAGGDAQDQDPVGGLRKRQEALQAEGNRPGPAGGRTSADPPSRGNGPRPRAPPVRPGRGPSWYGEDVSVGEKKNALKAALAQRAREERIVIVDRMDLATHRTKDLKAAVGALGISGKALFVDSRENENFARASRNVPG